MGLQMFDITTFDQRYHKIMPRDPQTVPILYAQDEHNDVLDGQGFLEESDDEVNALTDHEKYRLITPILTNIGNLVSCHSTKTFLSYVEQFKLVEDKIRKGENIFESPNDPSIEIVRTGEGQQSMASTLQAEQQIDLRIDPITISTPSQSVRNEEVEIPNAVPASR